MDPGKLEYYEFLDLSDIDENERQHLKQTLYSTSTPDFLQLPWTNHNFVAEEWQKEQYEDEVAPLPNGPSELPDPGGGQPPLPHPLPAVTIYSQPPPPYTIPPSSGYHPPQNVFVSNVNYMPGHYVQPHYTLPEPPDLGRGRRPRGRGKRNIEPDTSPGYGQPFVPMYHPAAYAAGSPLYIAPTYVPVYGTYGAHQYYPPQNIYQPEEEYETVIVNNLDPCEKPPETIEYINNVIPEVHKSAEVHKSDDSVETVKINNVEFVDQEIFNSESAVNISPESPVPSSIPMETKPEIVNIEQEPAPTTKSWASLFNKSAATPSAVQQPLPAPRRPSLTVEQKPEEKIIENEKEVPPKSPNLSIYTNDPISHRMGEFIAKYGLDNRTVSLQPRGLTNRSNYCYINSILQALLACPPFYNLLKALPHQPRKNANAKSPTPIIDSMVEFVNEFTPLSAESRLNRKEKGQRKDNIDVICGIAFEPAKIYKILNGIRTDTFIVEGRQEDAEEFFGCLLNGLNDEMLELSKLADGQIHQNLSNGDIATNGESHDQEEVEWTVMGPKNKGSITRRADFGRTPISDIFRGQLRSRVHRAGDQITDNVQPFFTLQLDIEKTSSVYEALELLVNKDKLEGVTCSRTNQQVEAWQQVTIEELPLVMVLHMKCFNYKLDGCTKIIKAVEFPIDLKIDSKLLSSKAKYTSRQKQYKLFSVVYHDGKEATKGHYLTDAYHVGYGGWVRYDDAVVKSVQENHVLHPNASRVPYLLFYRRCDTIGNQQNAKKE